MGSKGTAHSYSSLSLPTLITLNPSITLTEFLTTLTIINPSYSSGNGVTPTLALTDGELESQPYEGMKAHRAHTGGVHNWHIALTDGELES